MTDRYGQLGRIDDLEVAITCHRQALALCPHGDTNRSASLNNLANVVFTRYKQLGRMEDLEEAVTCLRQALALRPQVHGQLWRMEDLEEAITCHRQGLALRPHRHPDRPGSLSNLAVAVSTRFEQSGRMQDLEEAIKCHRQALALEPHGHFRRSYLLDNIVNAVFTRVGRMDDSNVTIKHLHSDLMAIHNVQVVSITLLMSCPLAFSI